MADDAIVRIILQESGSLSTKSTTQSSSTSTNQPTLIGSGNPSTLVRQQTVEIIQSLDKLGETFKSAYYGRDRNTDINKILTQTTEAGKQSQTTTTKATDNFNNVTKNGGASKSEEYLSKIAEKTDKNIEVFKDIQKSIHKVISIIGKKDKEEEGSWLPRAIIKGSLIAAGTITGSVLKASGIDVAEKAPVVAEAAIERLPSIIDMMSNLVQMQISAGAKVLTAVGNIGEAIGPQGLMAGFITAGLIAGVEYLLQKPPKEKPLTELDVQKAILKEMTEHVKPASIATLAIKENTKSIESIKNAIKVIAEKILSQGNMFNKQEITTPFEMTPGHVTDAYTPAVDDVRGGFYPSIDSQKEQNKLLESAYPESAPLAKGMVPFTSHTEAYNPSEPKGFYPKQPPSLSLIDPKYPEKPQEQLPKPTKLNTQIETPKTNLEPIAVDDEFILSMEPEASQNPRKPKTGFRKTELINELKKYGVIKEDQPHRNASDADIEEYRRRAREAGQEPKFAQGGWVGNHPGEPKGKDTIPAWLSEGEFVVNPDSASKNKRLLEDINNGKTKYMAEGGEVSKKTIEPTKAEKASLSEFGRIGEMMVAPIKNIAMGAIGFAKSSASASSDPAERISNFGGAITSAGQAVGKFLPVIGGVTEATGMVIQSFASLMQEIDKTVDKYAQYSPEIQQAKAIAEIRQTLGDIERAQTLGTELAQYVLTRSEIEQKFEETKVKILVQIMPAVNQILELINAMASSRGIEEAVKSVVEPIVELAKSMQELLNVKKDEKIKEIQDPTTQILESNEFNEGGDWVPVR